MNVNNGRGHHTHLINVASNLWLEDREQEGLEGIRAVERVHTLMAHQQGVVEEIQVCNNI